MLEVRLFGEFRIKIGGEPVRIPSRPAELLFIYLVLNPDTPVRRDKLAGLFWPESSEAQARSNLRHALWRLRKAIGEGSESRDEYIRVDDETILFDSSADAWVDVATLEREVDESWSIEEMIEALGVYQGELLPGFYEDWIVKERDRLGAVYEGKVHTLLEWLLGAGRWADALEWGERWIAMGGAPEGAYRALMAAHSHLDDLSSVAAVYRRCVVYLRQELGVEPSEQTRDLYERILEGEKPIPSPIPGVWEAEGGAPPAPGDPPYKGLQYFDQADADLFFGREALTARLVAHLASARFLAVVGASGSGKSSLVRAGLIPALRLGEPLSDGTRPPPGSTTWPVHVIEPSARPLEALAIALTRETETITATANLVDDLAKDPRCLHLYVSKMLGHTAKDGNSKTSEKRTLLVIDQFEELFTLCRSEAERGAFVDNLMTASQTEGPTIVVIALRADFFAHCGAYPSLRQALERQLVYIGTMSEEELRRAVMEPAVRCGWSFEPGLVEFTLQEVVGEPGALPLLSHVLLETWQRRRGRTLTFVGYNESGGLRGAIARTADRVFGAFDPTQKDIARGVFTRLTELGEGTQDTRRRVKFKELVGSSEVERGVDTVLQKLADARLITTGEDTVEVAHEALIREWPTLRRWLNENREALQTHRHLTESAQAWERMERDAGELYRGARLTQAEEWAQVHDVEMNPLEREFLEASLASARQREAEREAQRQRELEAAQKLAAAEVLRAEEQARSSARFRWLSAWLGFLLVVAVGLALVTLRQTNQAIEQTRFATARELSMAAISNMEVDPELSILLALQAVGQTYEVDQSVLPEAEDALHKAVQASRVLLTLPHGSGVAYSPNGDLLATAGPDNTARLWDAENGKELLTLSGHTDLVQNIAFSLDGNWVATTSYDGTAKIWDAKTGELGLTLSGHTAGLISPAFSPDGTLLATTSLDGTARVWDTRTGEELLTLSHAGLTGGVAFNPDGSLLAVADHDAYAAKIWDVSTGQEFLTLEGHTGGLNDLVFSPDGTLLATVSTDNTAKIWDVTTGEELLTLEGHNGFVFGVDFSPDGTQIATGSVDATAKLWDAITGQELLTLAGHAAGINNVAFSPDGKHLATGSSEGTKVWDITPTGSRELLTLVGHRDVAFRMDFSPDGSRLATGGFDGVARVWDLSSGGELVTLKGHTDLVYDATYNSDGSRLATASADGTAIVWDNETGQQVFAIHGHCGAIFDVDFSPDGAHLATACEEGVAKVWDAQNGAALLTLERHSGDFFSDVFGVAFSADGKYLATAGWDNTAKVWEASSGQELLTLSGHTERVNHVAFSPDGEYLATASWDGTAKVWELPSGREVTTLWGHSGVVWVVAFSPDGTSLATSSLDATAKVWDLAPGQLPLTLTGHKVGLGGLAFSPDGRYLAVGGGDGTVRIYVLSIEELVALAQERVTRWFTTEECQQYLHLEACPSAP